MDHLRLANAANGCPAHGLRGFLAVKRWFPKGDPQWLDGLWKIVDLGVSTNGGTPKMIVYNGKYHEDMDDDWG